MTAFAMTATAVDETQDLKDAVDVPVAETVVLDAEVIGTPADLPSSFSLPPLNIYRPQM